jgi:hypothetical protein
MSTQQDLREQSFTRAEIEVTDFLKALGQKYPLLRHQDMAVLFVQAGLDFVSALAREPEPRGVSAFVADGPTDGWEGGETPDGWSVMWLNVESSKVSALTYINDRGYNEDGPPVLVARFKGSAEIYRYLDVGPDIWHNLLRAAAGKLAGWTVGKFFSEFVEKAHYCELWDGLRWGEPKRGQRPGVTRP